jgi:hypothetical protein
MIDEKTHMWYTLSGRYGDLAWEMLEDMKGKKFSYRKANKHIRYIMQNWPVEEVCRTMRTWLINYPSMTPSKLDEFVSLEFRDKYSQYIVDNSPFVPWPKPSKI